MRDNTSTTQSFGSCLPDNRQKHKNKAETQKNKKKQGRKQNHSRTPQVVGWGRKFRRSQHKTRAQAQWTRERVGLKERRQRSQIVVVFFVRGDEGVAKKKLGGKKKEEAESG